MILCGVTRYIVPQAVDMLKLVSFSCVLAVALVVASSSHVSPESEPKPEESQALWSGFDSWIDADSENEENTASDDDLENDFVPENEEANDSEMISPSAGHRIVGGSPADIKEHPYQVSVYKHEYLTCGGSIISSQLVLTAAHCAPGEPSEYTVRAGSNYHGSGGEIHEVTYIHRHNKTRKHPKYDIPDYDVVVMRISGSFNYGPTINFIPLVTHTPAEGVEATVTGWGKTSWNGNPSRVLLAVNLPIISRKTCKKYYGNLITESMICAGFAESGHGICNGDSGGPLVSGGQQVGIASWMLRCTLGKKPDVFVDIAAVRSWIQEVMALYDK